MEEQLWICLYAYIGEEGQRYYEDRFICRAKNASEALWKYHFFLNLRKGSRDMPWKSYEEYAKTDFADGGWGYQALRLDESEGDRRDDMGWFYEKYNLLNL